jgi:hypothetical protein
MPERADIDGENRIAPVLNLGYCVGVEADCGDGIENGWTPKRGADGGGTRREPTAVARCAASRPRRRRVVRVRGTVDGHLLPAVVPFAKAWT